jgi:hypothetical protein
MFPPRRAFLLLVLAVAVPFTVPGRPARGDAVEDMLYSWLDNVMQCCVIKTPQKIIQIEDADVQMIFPGDRFYAVYFVTRPRADIPKGLSPQTLVRIRRDRSVDPIPSEEALGNFLALTLGNVRDDGQARTTALASLRLAEAVAKAGSSPFEQPNISIVRQGNNIVATARAAAQEPSRGEVAISLEFGADGQLNPDAIKINDRTSPGPPS